MKKILLIMVALMLTATLMPAQDKQQDRERVQLPEHLMLKDGNVFQVRDENSLQLREQLKLQNGTTINPDGSYQIQNQKQQRLKNGECLDMQGNRYKNQQEFGQQMQYRSHAMAQEHLMLQSGQMYRMQNQQQTQLKESVTLQNEIVVNPDGSIQVKNKKQQRLKDGECLDMQGNRYKNQQEFGQQMQYRSQLMAKEHFIFQNGQMYRIQNRQQTQLKESVTLQNGFTINPDGNIQAKDKKQIRLKEGECLDMQGNRYETQERYREGMENQNRERMGYGQDKDGSKQHDSGKGNKGK